MGYKIGDYVRNKKTKQRADIMVIYEDIPYVKVIVHPADCQCNEGSRWQTWHTDDVEFAA